VSLNQGSVVKTALGSTRIRCVVVDDHALLRQGVRRLLQDEPDFEVVDEAGDGTEALKMVLQHRPDLILMDIGMPGPSSFETARNIQRACPQTKVVFLTMHEDEEYVVEALQAGASGYLLKDTPAPKLMGFLREVYRGGKCVSPEVLGRLVDDFRSPRRNRLGLGNSSLTPREREVMKLLAEGNTVRGIAGMLRVSMKTIEAHKFNLMRKLDIHNKAQLVTCAIKKKILKLPLPI
jgi:two-component system, NarL family, response regulator NreC